jgi:L-amino acid N-acyltransferase YncA
MAVSPRPLLRDALRSDLPAIVEIYNRTIPGRMVTADTEPVSVASRQSWFDAHNPRTRPLWVIEPAAEPICGWLSFNSYYGRPAYNPTAEVSIYVAETHRRQGLGRWLLQEAVSRAPRHEIKTLLGFIWAHNEPSLRLFEQLGFSRWGFLPKVAIMDDIERDVVIVGQRVG